MGSCQRVPEQRLTLRAAGDEVFEGVVTKGAKAKQESSEESQSKDEKGPLIPVNLSVGYDGWKRKRSSCATDAKEACPQSELGLRARKPAFCSQVPSFPRARHLTPPNASFLL